MGATSVLVVEDDEGTREVLGEALAEAGYTVYQAPDGKPALERLRTHPEGLVVVLDWWMPGRDGLQVVQAVAAEAPLATRHSYILMTALGKTLPVPVVALLKQLGIPHGSKPFDLDDLLAAVAQAAARLSQHPS